MRLYLLGYPGMYLTAGTLDGPSALWVRYRAAGRVRTGDLHLGKVPRCHAALQPHGGKPFRTWIGVDPKDFP